MYLRHSVSWVLCLFLFLILEKISLFCPALGSRTGRCTHPLFAENSASFSFSQLLAAPVPAHQRLPGTLLGDWLLLFRMCWQALSFLLLGSFGVSLLVLVSASVPISEPMVLGGDHLIWILWLARRHFFSRNFSVQQAQSCIPSFVGCLSGLEMYELGVCFLPTHTTAPPGSQGFQI